MNNVQACLQGIDVYEISLAHSIENLVQDASI